MPVDRIDGKPHQVHAALVEFRLQLCESAELRCAHWREVLRVREQHRPAIADPVMEFDFALSGFGFEIRGGSANRKCHVTTSGHSSSGKFASMNIASGSAWVNREGLFLRVRLRRQKSRSKLDAAIGGKNPVPEANLAATRCCCRESDGTIVVLSILPSSRSRMGFAADLAGSRPKIVRSLRSGKFS